MKQFKEILGRRDGVVLLADRTGPLKDDALRLWLINLSDAPILVHDVALIVGSMPASAGNRTSRVQVGRVLQPGDDLELLSSVVAQKAIVGWASPEARMEVLVMGADVVLEVPITTGERDFTHVVDVRLNYGFFTDAGGPWPFSAQARPSGPTPEAVNRLTQW